MSNIFSRVPMTAIKVFMVAANSKTFTAAARELGVTQAAVSRQIAAIEDVLAMQLFLRGPRQISLTDEGRFLFHRLNPHFAALTDELSEIVDRRRDQTVNLRVYPTFAEHWLFPRIAAFEAAHPEILLRYDAKVEPLDFRSTNLDLAIQNGDEEWSGAQARTMFRAEIDPVCAPAYLADKFGGDPDLARVQGRLLVSRYRRKDWSEWQEASGLSFESNETLVFPSSSLCYHAAMSGLGIALAQMPLVAGAIARGELIRPFNRPIQDRATLSGHLAHAFVGSPQDTARYQLGTGRVRPAARLHRRICVTSKTPCGSCTFSWDSSAKAMVATPIASAAPTPLRAIPLTAKKTTI